MNTALISAVVAIGLALAAYAALLPPYANPDYNPAAAFNLNTRRNPFTPRTSAMSIADRTDVTSLLERLLADPTPRVIALGGGTVTNRALRRAALERGTLVTLRASLPVNDRVELLGRVENVTDERYQTVGGYGTQGRSAFVGARARF